MYYMYVSFCLKIKMLYKKEQCGHQMTRLFVSKTIENMAQKNKTDSNFGSPTWGFQNAIGKEYRKDDSY